MRLVLAAIICLMTTPALANDQALLDRIEAYFDKLTTIKADFVQVAPSGQLNTGTFFLKKPGKMRWQYDPPVPILMVANRGTLKYYDYELEQLSHIPLNDSLAGFLAQKEIRFDDPVIEVLKAEQKESVITVKLRQRDKPDEGELTMEFVPKPLQLRNIILKDAQGKETNVSLTAAEYGIALNNGLFEIKDPNFANRNKR